MSIAFACSRCGKHYTVEAALAGRQGRCKQCGRMMHVPNVSDDGDDTVATEGYDLSDPLPVATVPETEMGSVFVPAGIDAEVPRTARSRSSASVSTNRRARREAEEASLARRLRLVIAAPIVLLVALGVIALLVPNGTLIAACVLASVGGLLILIGYGVGLWAAFQEDLLYGFAYLFPLYAAYYIVTRWDGMWPFFVAMTVGATLVAIGGAIAGSKLEESKPAAAWRELGPDKAPISVASESTPHPTLPLKGGGILLAGSRSSPSPLEGEGRVGGWISEATCRARQAA